MCIQSGEWVIISRFSIREKLPFFKSLRFWIMSLLVIVGIIPSIVIERGIVNSYEDRAVSLRQSNVRNQCDILCNQLVSENYLNNIDSEVINGELTMLSTFYGGRILIINRDFKIVKDTYNLDAGKYALSQEVVDCFNGNSITSYDGENDYIEITSPIANPGSKNIQGVVLMSFSTQEIRDSIEILGQKGNMLLSVIIFLVLVLGYILSGILVRPFVRVSRSIEALTDGYLDEEISVTDYAETELITNAFNKLLSRMRILDESRQEFVSNVSHELKTPLASMKVLADSLVGQENVPIELYEEFMQDIALEIDRENKIITDLLSLVRLDKKAVDLNIQEVNINQLLELIVKRLRPIAAQNHVELILDSFRPVEAEIDEVKLTLALSNLVENAIKYNVENGWVRISINADHKYVYITVADSGVGIPEDSIERIFERFYRVDKSHSREIGGTGLGLAITRSVIVMHRGAIKVYSKEKEGTTFSVRIPLYYME
ncbi:MAG: sensor histidine kinase [Lachnospiraceae bacterium]|jgi:signal transduction histidine kinase